MWAEEPGELERRVAERTRELTEANQDLQLQLEQLRQIPVAAWTLKADGTPHWVNQGWLEFAGQTLEFVRSNPEAWMTAVHPDDREIAARAFWGGVSVGQGFEMETRDRRAEDGTYRWHLHRAVALRDADGKVLKFVGTSTDIDDRKRAEEALKAGQNNLRQILDNMPGLLATLGPGGEVELVNQQYLDYFGKSLEEIRNWRGNDILHPDDLHRVEAAFTHAITTGTALIEEFRYRRADGVFRWFHARGFPMRDTDGRIARWYVLATDIDDRKHAEDALSKIRSELAHVTRVTSLGALAASIAHEVNQPLSGILTNANTGLRMLGADPPNVAGALETTRRTIRDVRRASEVMARLRALFTKKDTTTEPVDLNEATREVIALTMTELQRNRIVLRPELADGLAPVSGDRIQLQQVVLNLLLNASDAMSGVVDRPRQVVIRTERDQGDCVRLTVQDAGVGIDPENPEKLFEAFYTTKTTGMGMGLSVSRSIIESHRGRLWAAPNNGPGASFSFSIPHWAQDTRLAGSIQY